MRFCGNCGTRLAETVPAGAKSTPPAEPQAIPEQLGVLTGADLLERFRQAGLEASGQRRSVTVLFVDLTGYTHLGEELNDEELYEVVQRFMQVMVNDVYKYEGMVDKFTGDGLMALFGAPIAHENNAERALRAALDMQADVARLAREIDLHGQELRIHIGLNAGTVIVGGLGSDGMMNYTAIGDSVNMARRLEESAGPGTTLVSESLYRQTRRLFDFEVIPSLTLKNVSRPVTAYRMLGPKQKPGQVRGLEGLHAPMIGREQEFRRVQQMVEHLTVDGQGGVILLVGEGGMGKSRLTSEVKAQLDGSRVRVLEGQSLTYRKSIAYWIFQEVLRNYLSLSQDAPEAEVRSRLSRSAKALLGTGWQEKLAYLEYLFSYEPSGAAGKGIRYLEAGQLRQQVFLAVRDLLVAEARQRPLLLILEDLHWADDASLDLVRFLLDSTRRAPLLIYAISRPFDSTGVQAVHKHASQRLAERYLYLQLQALPPDQSAQLLQALLTIQDLPETLRSQIIQRSAGLPFYLEEILRMLIENNIIYHEAGSGETPGQWRLVPGADISRVGVPETLQGLILARFDRLLPAQRRILQTASVIGYQFNELVLFNVLSSLPDAPDEAGIRRTLDFLVGHEYILPQAGEGASNLAAAERNYVFKHVLVSDAVYSTLLQRDRRDLHTRVGQAIEQLYAGHLEGQIEVLAGHYLRSPLLDQALHYLILAGQKAARSYATMQSAQQFTQALEVLPKVDHTPEQAVQVYLGLGDALLTSGDYPTAREYFNRGLEALDSRPGTGTLGGALRVRPTDWIERRRIVSTLQRKIARTQESQGEYEKALACLRAAQELLEGSDLDFPAERANILSDMGWIDFRRGALDKAEMTLRDALTLAEAAGQPDVLASVLNRLGGIYFQRDVPEQASRYLARSLVLREQIGDVVAVARSYNNLGLLGWKQGDLVAALENFNHSFELQANLGDVEGLIMLHNNMGLIELDLGNLQAAERHFQEALQSSSQIGHQFHACQARMHLALLNIYAKDWRRALEHGQVGLAGFQEMGVMENQVDLNVTLGLAYLGLDAQEHVDEIVQRINDLLKDSSIKGPTEGEGRAQRFFGLLAITRGDLTAARVALEKSAAVFSQVGTPIERSRVLVDLAELQARSGETQSARQALEDARVIFTRSGIKLELARLKEVEESL